MPQIWMTYDELGGLLDSDAGSARRHAIDQVWPRRRSRDGNTRVKLPEAQVAAYLDRMFSDRLASMQTSASRIHAIQALAEDFAASSAGRGSTRDEHGAAITNAA